MNRSKGKSQKEKRVGEYIKGGAREGQHIERGGGIS